MPHSSFDRHSTPRHSLGRACACQSPYLGNVQTQSKTNKFPGGPATLGFFSLSFHVQAAPYITTGSATFFSLNILALKWLGHFFNTVEPLWKGQECLTKFAKLCSFPCTILYKSCLFYPSWQATSFERHPSWVAFIEGFHCMWFHFLMLFTFCAIVLYETGPKQLIFSQQCAKAPGHQ